MPSRVRLAIVSPDPFDNSQGVERFCHTLKDAIFDHRIDAEIVSKSDFDQSKYDVVLTNALVSVRTKIPRIHVYHGCHIPQIMKSHAEASVRWRVKFIIEAAFREVKNGIRAHRVSVSNSCAEEIRRWYGLSSHVIENGIDTSVFDGAERSSSRTELDIPQDARMALFIGRPEWRKRPDIAMAAAEENGYSLFLAAGRQFEGMHWLGKLTPDKLSLAISAADVVLMPTQYEACSLALLEALSVGTPVITTDAGWVPDLLRKVPEYAVLVSPVGDVTSFAEALGNINQVGNGISKARDFVRVNNSLETFGVLWSNYIHGILKLENKSQFSSRGKWARK